MDATIEIESTKKRFKNNNTPGDRLSVSDPGKCPHNMVLDS